MPTDTYLRGIPPSYVPSGFEFRREIGGINAGGFGENPTQVGLLYARDWSSFGLENLLVAYAAEPGAGDLDATEHRSGQQVDVDIGSAEAVYHDGLWAPGPGEAEVDLGEGVVIHWERSITHSITIYAPKGSYAIRAPMDTVPFDELVRVAKSLNIGG